MLNIFCNFTLFQQTLLWPVFNMANELSGCKNKGKFKSLQSKIEIELQIKITNIKWTSRNW